MNCEICQVDDSGCLVILPMRQHNGSLITLACVGCAEKTTCFCKRHFSPHIGFTDQTTMCVACCWQKLAQYRNRASEFAGRILQAVSEPQELKEMSMALSELSHETREVCILGLAVRRALRSDIDVEEVVESVVAERSAQLLLS